MFTIPLVIQHRHVHLSKLDARRLFGEDYALRIEAPLSHRGQILYQETVSIVGKNQTIESVRVLGPSREKTQVELSLSDVHALGLRVSVRTSGDLVRVGSCKLIGAHGAIRATSSVIIPARHLHCNEKVAQKMNLKHHSVVCLQHVERPDVLLENVFVRVHPTFTLELHLTADEAAQHWLSNLDVFTICA